MRECLALDDLRRHAQAAQTVMVDREVIGYAVALADATRHPAEHGLDDIAGMIEFGASPRGPIGLVQAARALALLRGRAHVEVEDIRDLTPDVLRHRIVLSYDALERRGHRRRADRAGPGHRARARRAPAHAHRARGPQRRGVDERVSDAAPRAARRAPGPRPDPAAARRGDRPRRQPSRGPDPARATAAPPASAWAPSSPSCARTRSATTCATSTPPPARAPARPTCACTCPSGR